MAESSCPICSLLSVAKGDDFGELMPEVISVYFETFLFQFLPVLSHIEFVLRVILIEQILIVGRMKQEVKRAVE